jgi:hypothetical protein
LWYAIRAWLDKELAPGTIAPDDIYLLNEKVTYQCALSRQAIEPAVSREQRGGAPLAPLLQRSLCSCYRWSVGDPGRRWESDRAAMHMALAVLRQQGPALPLAAVATCEEFE